MTVSNLPASDSLTLNTTNGKSTAAFCGSVMVHVISLFLNMLEIADSTSVSNIFFSNTSSSTVPHRKGDSVFSSLIGAFVEQNIAVSDCSDGSDFVS